MSDSPLRLCALVSGGGRTVLNLLDRIEAGRLPATIPLVIADRPCAAVERLAARGLSVELVRWGRETTAEDYAATVWPRIESARCDLVVACGFLRLLRIPSRWEGRVMNIHPGLLPRYGGKGMYGDRVHAAVLKAGESESGCTVHFSDNEYDRGPIILQRRVPVLSGDTVQSLAERVFQAECEAYPEAIRLFAENRLEIRGDRVVIRNGEESK